MYQVLLVGPIGLEPGTKGLLENMLKKQLLLRELEGSYLQCK